MTNPRHNEVKYSDSLKCRFIFVYGLIGFTTTLGLLTYLLIANSTSNASFFYAVLITMPILGATAYFGYVKRAGVASYLALLTMIMGCFGALNLPFAAFLSLIMIFVLSAMFVTIKPIQNVIIYCIMLLSTTIKVLFELGVIEAETIPDSDLSGETVFYISCFLLSIFAYAYIVNILLNQGLQSSEKLAETLRIKDRLVALISHDLRSPIGNIAAMIDGIKNKAIPPSEEVFGMIHQASSQTTRLIDNLLLWSTANQHQSIIQKEAIRMKDCVDESVNFLQLMLKKKEITIHNHCDEHAMALADASMTKAIIRNLLTNAVKFSHHGGEVFIKTETGQDYVKTSLQDNGVGMTRELTNRLFEEHDRISSTGTANEGGSGLGLMICKDFVKFNDGEIGADSEKGKGSTFWFKLPLAIVNPDDIQSEEELVAPELVKDADS